MKTFKEFSKDVDIKDFEEDLVKEKSSDKKEGE